MISINEIVISAVDDNLEKFINYAASNPSQNEAQSIAVTYEALMNFSKLLLEKYHLALKDELSKHGIEL